MMRVAVFSAKPYEIDYLNQANRDHQHELRFLEAKLDAQTVTLAEGHSAVCCFVTCMATARNSPWRWPSTP